MRFWFGHRILMTHLARAIMVSTLFSTSEFIRAKIEHSSLSLTTKSKIQSGFQMAKDLSSYQANSQPRQPCTVQMVSLFLSSENASETRWESAHLVIRSWWEGLEILPKVRWTSGTSKLLKNMEKLPNLHAHQKWTGLPVAGTCWHRYFTIDWKWTIASKFLEQMELKSWKSLKDLRNFTILNGNLMKQVYCQNQMLKGSEKPRCRVKTKSQRESSSMERVAVLEVVVKIAHFSKWWDSQWRAQTQRKVLKRLICINTKNCRSSRQLKLKKVLSPKRLPVLPACMLPLPGMVRRPLEQDKPLKVQHPVWKIKKLALVVVLPKAVPTGDLENSTMTMTTISITLKMLR